MNNSKMNQSMINDYIKKAQWKSPTLGKDKEMQVVGHEGTPVLVFASKQGDGNEWRQRGMFEALQEQVYEGYNQFYCISGIDAPEASKTDDVHSAEGAGEIPVMDRNQDDPSHSPNSPHPSSDSITAPTQPMLWRLEQYQSYVSDEVLSYINRQNANDYIIAAGVGEGAYYAAHAAFENPDRIKKVILMGGVFSLGHTAEADQGPHGTAQNPGAHLFQHMMPLQHTLEHLDIRILTYENDPHRNESRVLSDALWHRSLEHQFHVWNLHAENAWQLAGQMMREHIF